MITGVPSSLRIEHAGLFSAFRATQPLTPKDSATDAVACQEAGQGDSQTERQEQPEEGYEGSAPFPASRFFEIVPKVLKNGLFLPDKLAQAATGFLAIGGEAGLQDFQPIEGRIQRSIEFLADVTPVALRIGMGLGRLCGVPAFSGGLLDVRENLAVSVQFPGHVGDDRAQEVEGFTKGGVGKGRVRGTGVRHYDFRDQG